MEEMTLVQALEKGGWKAHHIRGMNTYALEGVEKFVRDNPHWDINHAGALFLYTLQYPGEGLCHYFVVNDILRGTGADRALQLRPHLPTPKLQALGINKLPA